MFQNQERERENVHLQILKTRCAVGPLYCQHMWMPRSINFSLNSPTRIYETCNMGLQLFWSLHTCSAWCCLHSRFERAQRSRNTEALHAASCGEKGFKCIYILLSLLGTALLQANEAAEQVSFCYSWHQCASHRHTTLTHLPSLFPLSSPVQIINKRKYIIPLFQSQSQSGSAKVNTKQS